MSKPKPIFKLTPENFVELVVLGVYWEYGELKSREVCPGRTVVEYGWTTVNHVLGMLRGLGIITPEQVKLIQHPTDGQGYQRKLYRHCGLACGNEYTTDPYSWLLCRKGQRSISDVPRFIVRLVRDKGIQIHGDGFQRAVGFEQKYVALVSKKQYLAEAARVEEVELAEE